MIQLSEIESYRKGLNDKVDEFGKQIREFASRYFPNGAIDFYSNFVMVYSRNVTAWNKALHCRLCDEFGLKLIQVEKRENFGSEYRQSYQIYWKYTGKDDTNFKELDFDKVRL